MQSTRRTHIPSLLHASILVTIHVTRARVTSLLRAAHTQSVESANKKAGNMLHLPASGSSENRHCIG